MASEIRSRYTQELATRGYTSDAAQEMAVTHLQRLYDDLVKDWDDHYQPEDETE